MLRLHEMDEGRLDPAAVEFRVEFAAVAFATVMIVVSAAERLRISLQGNGSPLARG